MPHLEQDVAAHYGETDLMAVLLHAAGQADGGFDPARLALIDEFHVGGGPATIRVLDGLNLTPGQRLLDIGAGIGGPARRAAHDYGAEVTGIDLTQRFVDIATDLTARVKTHPAPRFVQGSALALPLENDSFDAAMLLHVGMNIADKLGLMAEVARVLRPGGRFAVYDIMRTDAGDQDAPLTWPLPWATGPETSFVATATDYRAAAAAAGLTMTAEIPRGDDARAFFAAGRAKAAAASAGGLPAPLGIGLVMGADAPTKFANLAAAIDRGVIAPIEIYFRKPAPPSHP